MVKKVIHDDIAIEAESIEQAKAKVEFLFENSNSDYAVVYPTVGFDSQEIEDSKEIENPDKEELGVAKENEDKIEEIKEEESETETLICTARGCLSPQVADGEFCEEHIK